MLKLIGIVIGGVLGVFGALEITYLTFAIQWMPDDAVSHSFAAQLLKTL